jgi:hypothetical protein
MVLHNISCTVFISSISIQLPFMYDAAVKCFVQVLQPVCMLICDENTVATCFCVDC